MERYSEILSGVLWETWVILNYSTPYVLLGFIVAALLKAFIPDSLVQRHLGKPGMGGVIKAALFGIPIPLCSCGVIPAAMGLRKQGASRGSVVSFLVSTPETGVDSITITWALFDPIMTVFRPVAAFVTAIVTGLLENLVSSDEPVSEPAPAPEINSAHACGCDHGCAVETPGEIHQKNLMSRLKDGYNFAFGDLLSDIGKWLLMGIFLAGIVAYAVPDNFFERHLGQGILPMLLMLIAGIPVYICATASTPLAAALVMKGLSPGAALVFLIAGPATNVATMMVVYKFFGGKSLAIYLVSIAVCALAFGYLLDLLYSGNELNIGIAITCSSCGSPGWFNILSTAVLIGLIIRSMWHARTGHEKFP